MAKHVFLSYVIEDKNLVTLFRGQAKIKNSDLAFDDYLVREPINSASAPFIKIKITDKVTASAVLICLIGYDTHKSDWVDWEIRRAVELKKKMIGVRLHSDSTRDKAPAALVSTGAKVLNWEIDKIVSAIG
jgi:hypothetical protein